MKTVINLRRVVITFDYPNPHNQTIWEMALFITYPYD